MSAFPGLIRARELERHSDERADHSKAPSQTGDRMSRLPTVDSPYFTSHGNSENALSLAQKAKVVGDRIVHAAKTSTPRLDYRNTSVPHPLLKRSRSRGFAATEVTATGGLSCFEDSKTTVRSPSVQNSEISARDGQRVTDVDFLYVNAPRLRRGHSDDTSSVKSGETRLSGSSNSLKESKCCECRTSGHVNMPLVKCLACSNRFHDHPKCLNAKTCIGKSGKDFTCMQCTSKGRSRAAISLPPAEDASMLLPVPNDLAPSPDAITKSQVLSSGGYPDKRLSSHTEPQSQRIHNNGSELLIHDEGIMSVKESRASSTYVDRFTSKETITEHESSQGRPVDMSNVPNAPAAMRENSSPILQRIPHTHNLIDSYRPGPSPVQMSARGSNSYGPSERSRPPAYLEKEREMFLRRAPQAERERYLRQNRTAICKEIACPHFLRNDCKHGRECIYAHEDTGLYFPAPKRPAKRWTCSSWMFDLSPCHLREEDCLLAHYDTGIYADKKGRALTKHITCFWWFNNHSCHKEQQCPFAHYETGIVAQDPSLSRNKGSFERNSHLDRPQAPTREISDPRRPQASTSSSPPPFINSSPQIVRDTPLSPVEPIGSDSDDLHTEPSATTVHPTQPQSVTEPSPIIRPESVTGTPNDENHAFKIQSTVPGSLISTSPANLKDFRQDATPPEMTPDTNTPPIAVPKQYARRTGGVKISRSSDLRRRKLESTTAESPHQRLDEKSWPEKSEVQIPSTQLNTDIQPVENSSYPKCQTCHKLILSNQAASHKCKRKMDYQIENLQQLSGHPASSRERGVMGFSQESPSLIEQGKEPDVTISPSEIGHMFSRTLSDSSLPNLPSHGLKRAASGSDADAMFIPNKKRRMGPPTLPRAVSSASSLNAAQASGLWPANSDGAVETCLSIADLTELEALRKEFDVSEATQLDDDATTLKLLQAKKRKKIAQEALAREEAETAEIEQRKAKLRAERERILKEEAEAEAAEIAEFERIRKERKERERLRAQEAQEPRDRQDERARTNVVPHVASSTNPSRSGSMFEPALPLVRSNGLTTRAQISLASSSGKRHFANRDIETRSRAIEPVSNMIISPSPANFAGETNNANGPQLVYPEEDDSESQTVLRSPRQPGAACKDCRRRHWKCTHRNIPSAVNEKSFASNDDFSPLEDVANGMSVTKTAARAFRRDRVAAGDKSLNETNSSSVQSMDHAEDQSNAADHDTDDEGFPDCSNCGVKTSKGNCHGLQKGHPSRCIKCYKYHWRTGKERPAEDPAAAKTDAELSDEEGNSGPANPPAADNALPIEHTDDDGSPRCNHCNVATLKRLRRWKSTDYRLCDPCYMYRYGHGVDRPIEQQVTKLSCGNCGLLPPKRLRRLSLKDSLLCDRCYTYRLNKGIDRPLNYHDSNEDVAAEDFRAEKAQPLGEKDKAGVGFTYHLEKENKCLTAQCVYCGWKQAQNSTLEKQHRRECSKVRPLRKANDTAPDVITGSSRTPTRQQRLDQNSSHDDIVDDNDESRGDPSSEILGIGDSQVFAQEDDTAMGFTYFPQAGKKCLTAQCIRCGWERAKNPTREKQHQRECSKSRTLRRDNNAAANLAENSSCAQSPQRALDANGQDEVTGLKTAKSLASEVVRRFSGPAPNSIAPDEIQALFCEPGQSFQDTNGVDDKATPLKVDDHRTDYTVTRLVQTKVLNDEEQAAAVARLRAQGVEVDSANSDSDGSWGSWSDVDFSESTSYPFPPVSLVQNARYEQEPDPRHWVDDEEDEKFYTFDSEAARKRILARPSRKANVIARRNGKKPGALLAMSDWQSRIRNYGSFHRETDRNPGPQSKGTFIREIADRTRLTLQSGFDDQEIMREEVEGTMQEFLGHPREVQYDTMDAHRLMAARTLAFSDGTVVRRRVPDSEKFPVGRGG